MTGNKDSKNVLIVDPSEKERQKAFQAAQELGYKSQGVSSISEAIKVLSTVRWHRVVTTPHTIEGDSVRSSSDLVERCQKEKIPCVVIANTSGIESLIQGFINEALAAGAMFAVRNKNWYFALAHTHKGL